MFASLLFLTLQGTDLTTKLPVQLPVCMTRAYKDGADKARVFPIVVDALDTAKYVKAGFAVATCATLKVDPAAYRTRVCRMAAFGNLNVQRQFEIVIGAPPKALCDATKTLGARIDSVLTKQ